LGGSQSSGCGSSGDEVSSFPCGIYHIHDCIMSVHIQEFSNEVHTDDACYGYIVSLHIFPRIGFTDAFPTCSQCSKCSQCVPNSKSLLLCSFLIYIFTFIPYSISTGQLHIVYSDQLCLQVRQTYNMKHSSLSKNGKPRLNASERLEQALTINGLVQPY
jgi:hypothetical protein